VDRKKLVQQAPTLLKAIEKALELLSCSPGLGDLNAALAVLREARASVLPDAKGTIKLTMTANMGEKLSWALFPHKRLQVLAERYLKISSKRAYLVIPREKGHLNGVRKIVQQLARDAKTTQSTKAWKRLETELETELARCPTALEILAMEAPGD